ncbi:Uncharacterised protein [Aedoeadaptatus ivorii]|uniref:YcxB-like protein domain-containing protein n=1 Tax=Aedoeadaptatus ivorii TaxID=54006 RepID=A0A448V0D4_9FIRM|nr:hypothetical protein [Peptoniphilus ivorii]MDQ0507977.1 hypothetical protein [Peptoniphilus ivorii]VEJ34815.1 Uncharacterised protein [Peptoniphilus ivorii]
MKHRFTLSEEDYFRYQWFMFLNNPAAKRTMRIQQFLPMAVFVAVAIFYLFTEKSIKDLLPLAGVLVLWPFVYVFFFKRSMRKKLKSLIARMKDDLPLGEHTVTIEDGALADGDVRFSFDEIRGICEADRHYYIFYGDHPAAYLLPKEAADAQLAALAEQKKTDTPPFV